MIDAIVVDDEPLARRTIVGLLQRDAEIRVVGECGSGAEALAAIRAAKPELLFLDVEMPEYDGFDVLEMLGADVPAAVIFVTAYDAYALRAFEAGALDYLLKPFDDARFERAVARAKARVEGGRLAPHAPSTLVVKSAGSVVFLKLADVDWIESADYYSRLHVGSRTHLLRRSMAEFERDLDRAEFCRIHRSAIVRVDRIARLELNASGEYDVVLDEGTVLRLSRRYRKDVQSRLSVRGAAAT